MGIVFDEVLGNVESPPPGPTQEQEARPSPPRDPERDRVRSLSCRERRLAARLEAD